MKRVLHLIIPFFLFALCFLSGNTIIAQGWERTFGTNVEDNAYSVVQTLDGGYALLGFAQSASSVGTNVILIKTDEDGDEQWSRSYGGLGDDKGYEIVQAGDGTYAIVGQTSSTGNGEEDVLLIKTDSYGEELWRKTYGGAYNDRGFSITIAANGDYILVGRTEMIDNEKGNVYLIRTDANGNLRWERNFGGSDTDVGNSVIEAANGDIVIAGETRSFATPNPNSPTAPSPDVYFIKTNADGEVLVEKSYGNLEQDIAYDLVETSEGNFVLTGVTTNRAQVYILSLDKEGKELWSKSYGSVRVDIGYSIALTPDNGFIIVGEKEITDSRSQIYLLKTDSQGELEFERLFGSFGLDVGRSVATTTDGGYIIAGNLDINNPENGSLLSLYDMYLIKTNAQGNVFPNIITGIVHRDKNTNCEKDEDENVLEDWLIRLRSGDNIIYATTDENGGYSVTVEDGSYNVGAVILNTAWEVCQNYNVTFAETDTMQLDFAVRATVENCPVLEVDISTAVLEPCEDANYIVNVCNRGIATAEDAYIDVQFDPYLTVNYSTLPWTENVGNIYRFDIGDLRVEECGSFEINTTLSCDAVVGQGHCVEAYAHPDPICIPPPPTWEGASIRVDGECIGDSVLFIIKNVGDGNMNEPTNFVVIEDHIMLRQLSGEIQLSSGRSDSIYITATASTYRIIAEQPPGHPYGETASAAVEGCPFGRPFNTGFLTSFSDSDALPFYSLDCQENKIISGNVALTPSPKGVGSANSISSKDDLEYHIYFQNTGSDTVNQVIVRDTLSKDFDITSLIAGASSHTYDYEISGAGILKFTFKNINLLSAEENEAKSHGFVKFRISQKRGNPAGMVIENRAEILFDFGAPILSNTTFHTIGGEEVEDYIEVSTNVDELYVPNLEVKISPNPFDASRGATIELIGLEGVTDVQFDLFDVAGRRVQGNRYNSPKFQFYPSDLPQGLYIYTIRIEGGLVNTGKVFIK